MTLTVANAVCVAACSVEPCAYRKAPAKRTSHCHHTGAPAGESRSTEKQPCSHQLLVVDTQNERGSPLAVLAPLRIELDSSRHGDRLPIREPIHVPPDPFPQLTSILRI